MAGIAGYGADLLLSDMEPVGVPGFNLIANVTNIGGPSLALDTEDVTSHDSTGGWEEVVATILRTGEVTLDINYDPASKMHTIGVGAGHLITGVDVAPANEFIITGDHTALFTAGLHFRVDGSTNNDESYEVVSSSFGAGDTTIVVVEAVAAIADGNIIVTTLPMAMQERVAVNCILRFSDIAATEWTFSGYVNKFEPGAPYEGKLTASVSLKLTGVPVLV